jgi:peptidoglycan/xylan/chitin deacetylase (PgdA/CDA1 family)
LVEAWLAARDGQRPLFLTFDDGGVSAHEVIANALERRGWRGHFFVTAGRIDTPGFVTRAQIRELRQRGHLIGTHSFSHPARMGACSEVMLLDEWTRSVAILSEILNEPVTTGSVPGGFYTPLVGDTAGRSGLRLLFTSRPTTSCEHTRGCHILGRYTLRSWSKATTAGALATGDWRPRTAQWALYGGLGLLRTIGGSHYTRIRQKFWSR